MANEVAVTPPGVVIYKRKAGREGGGGRGSRISYFRSRIPWPAL